MTMITPSYLGETIEYSSLHACRSTLEDPTLQKEATAQGRKVRVVLVSLDFGKELESKLLPFVRERRLRGQVIALLDDDYNKWIDQVSPEWSGAIPATLIYRGEDRSFFPEAFDSYPDLEAALADFAR